MGCKRLLLQNKSFLLLVCLDELHRDQHGFHPKEAQAYPDIARLAVPVDENFLNPTDLLTQGIEDGVTGGPLGCR